MKTVDNFFKVKKEVRPNGNRVYTFYNFFGEKVATSKSISRDYIAFYLHVTDRGKNCEVLNRFSRLDLVGKGDSRYYENDPDVLLVALEGEQ